MGNVRLSRFSGINWFRTPELLAMLGFAYYLLGRYMDALPHMQEAASRAPNHGHSRRY